MMSRKITKVAVIIPFLVVLSCASVMADIPSPSTQMDTLVAIPVIRMSLRSTDDPFEVSYQINVENVESGKLYPLNFSVNDSQDYQYVRGLPPGQYIVRDFASYGLINSPNRPLRVQKTLIVEQGKISLLPIKAISIILTRKTDNAALFSIDFVEYDDGQRMRMLNILGKDKNYAKWGH